MKAGTSDPQQPPPARGEADDGLEACRSRLHRFLARRRQGDRDINDLVQEVYVRFLQSTRRGLMPEPVGYLFRIAANLIHDMHDREQRAPVTFDSEVVDTLAEHPASVEQDPLSERLNAQQQLEQTLAQLPGLYQSVLLLRKRDGLTCAEIAKELKISKHTAEKYLYRAIAHFKAADWEDPT